MSGGVLLSHTVPRAVPSALKGLASGFGMEPGVSLSPWPPKLYGDISVLPQPHRPKAMTLGARFPTVSREPHSGRVCSMGEPKEVAVCGQALGLLVPVSCTDYSASTSGLSTRWSCRGPYQVNPVGDLILKRASRLDAFSGYPCRT